MPKQPVLIKKRKKRKKKKKEKNQRLLERIPSFKSVLKGFRKHLIVLDKVIHSRSI